MSLRSTARRMVQAAGLDVQRYPESDSLWPVVQCLNDHRVDLVLDVGANDGGYVRSLRRCGYDGVVVSFEPLAGPYSELARAAQDDLRWYCRRVALGDTAGALVLNVAGNHGRSSSALPMRALHATSAPKSSYVGSESVPCETLDGVVEGLDAAMRLFLKIDVQGYERQVLAGATKLLASPRLAGLQVELSFADLYEGAWQWREALDYLEQLGYVVHRLIPGFSGSAGRMLQADAVLVRRLEPTTARAERS